VGKTSADNGYSGGQGFTLAGYVPHSQLPMTNQLIANRESSDGNDCSASAKTAQTWGVLVATAADGLG
jgi:hypothetical protein